jgi:hypothetical protein
MRQAGPETLGDRLRKEGRLHLDLLQRFGEDLLDVVRFLEEQGIPHRDIKPENIGVGKVGRGDKLHLLLFDFSLSRTPPENIHAGTRGYLEPFLSQRKPVRWDLHAERYAAAVTLYELAAGMLPKWGDGKSDPALLDCEATIDAELLDASVRDRLTAFFSKALRRNPAERFDNAEEMLREWRRCFEGIAQPVATGLEEWGEVEKRLQQATLATRIAELGLGARATNALDRINVLSVRDLLLFPLAGLTRLRGVGNTTRREITDAVRTLRLHLTVPEQMPGGGASRILTPSEEPEPAVTSVDMLAVRVMRTDPRTRSHSERHFLTAFLGLDSELADPWPSQTDVAVYLGVTRGRIGQLVVAAQERWRRDPSITNLRNDVAELLTTAGGVMTAEGLARAVLLARGSVEDEPRRSRLALAVTRAAVEVERVMAEPRLVVRRDRNRVLVTTSQVLADYAVRLAREADSLAGEDPLVPPLTVLERLRRVRCPTAMEPLTDARLVRLAATSSQNACVSSRQEIYPRGMDPIRALKLSQGALLGISLLAVDQIRERVSGRYPEAAALPDRPELDSLLKTAGFDLDWDPTAAPGGVYRSRALEFQLSSVPSGTIPRLPTRAGPPVSEISPEVAQARQFEERLQRAVADGTFVAMTVEPRAYFRAKEELCSRFSVQPIDVEAAFLQALRDVAAKARVRWERVLQADAAPGSDDWGKLMQLVRRSVPQVEASILAAERTVLLVYPGLLARYEQMELLQRLRDKAGRPGGIPGLWMLIAADESAEMPLLDGCPVPVIGRAEWARIPESWLQNQHRG